MTIRVLLLMQWFEPEPTFKGLAFARALTQQGFEVEVVTGFPNYPGGKIYPGYKLKWLQRESIDGVLVTRVPLYPSHDESAIRRALNSISFAASSLLYSLFVAKKPNIIYATTPFTIGIGAALVAFFRRIPMVYDIQDMWPDTLRGTGVVSNERALTAISKVCDWIYRRATHIVVLSPGFKDMLVGRGVDAEKIEVIYNWCDEISLTSCAESVPSAFPGKEKFRILFAGNMGKAQALAVVLDAAEIVQSKAPEVCFIFLGGGVELAGLKQVARTKALKNVAFLPRVPMSEVGSVLSASDALLVHLRRDPLFETTIPSKTQAYMAIGKPILMAVNGDAASLGEKAECGVIAESESAQAIAAAAIHLSGLSVESRKMMADNGRRFYEENLSLRIGAARFGAIFKDLGGGKQVGGVSPHTVF